MLIIEKRRLIKIAIFLFITVIFFSFSKFEGKKISALSDKETKIIVIDAGHGLPDGGAVGMNGTIESVVNLQLSKQIEKKLKNIGYKVIMTRKSENGIFDCEGGMAEKKRNDMKNRLKIINSSNADMLISIHMNKFPDSKYSGAQVLYSSNYERSKQLAEAIQSEFQNMKDNPSKRSALKAPDGLYLMRNSSVPAVIAECGFLSNYGEEKNLNNKSYQQELANAVVNGIKAYYIEVYGEQEV